MRATFGRKAPSGNSAVDRPNHERDMAVGALALFASSREEPHAIYSAGAVPAQSISRIFCATFGSVPGELFACPTLVSIGAIAQVADWRSPTALDEPGQAEYEAYGLGFRAENGWCQFG